MIKQIHDKYGFEDMREVWIEELLELATKLQQSKRDKGRNIAGIEDELREEIADVSFVIDQMVWYYGEEECAEWKKYKIERTKERLL